jgi:hypothetical protein
MAEISNPSSRILSIIFPVFPYCITWGLIKHSVQLVSKALEQVFLAWSPKNISLSSSLDIASELQCTAFLMVSFPKIALIELGLSDFAFNGFSGPTTYLTCAMEDSPTISSPTTTSEVKNF